MVGGAHTEWAIRPAVYICDLRHGAVVHTDCDRPILASVETAGGSPTLSVHGISVAARALRSDRRGMDLEHDHYSSLRGFLGNSHCADWNPGLSLLETQPSLPPSFAVSRCSCRNFPLRHVTFSDIPLRYPTRLTGGVGVFAFVILLAPGHTLGRI